MRCVVCYSFKFSSLIKEFMMITLMMANFMQHAADDNQSLLILI